MPRFDAVAAVVVERVLGTCPKALRRRHKERVGLVLKGKFKVLIFLLLRCGFHFTRVADTRCNDDKIELFPWKAGGFFFRS